MNSALTSAIGRAPHGSLRIEHAPFANERGAGSLWHKPNHWSAELRFGTMPARQTQNTAPGELDGLWGRAFAPDRIVQIGKSSRFLRENHAGDPKTETAR